MFVNFTSRPQPPDHQPPDACWDRGGASQTWCSQAEPGNKNELRLLSAPLSKSLPRYSLRGGGERTDESVTALLLTSQQTMHLMAKAAVTVYES